MTEHQILLELAQLDPVPDEPAYDACAEHELHQLLRTLRTEPGAGARPVARPARPLARAAVAAAALAAATAGVFASGALTGGGARTPTVPLVKAPPGHAHARLLDAKLVADRAGAALASARDYILESDELLTSAASGNVYRSRTWTDPQTTGNFRDLEYGAGGAPAFESATYTGAGRQTDLAIDYPAREYTVTSLSSADVARRLAANLARKRAALAGHAAHARATKPRSGSEAATIRHDLAAGHDRLLGRTSLHGRSVLLLSNDEPGMHRRIWIDPATYLPVQMTAHGSFGSYVIAYTWIPRTPASLRATFAAPAPAGFTKVARLPDQ
jgi:hypothetical protein